MYQNIEVEITRAQVSIVEDIVVTLYRSKTSKRLLFNFILYYFVVCDSMIIFFYIWKATLIVNCSLEYGTEIIIDSFLFLVCEILGNKMHRKWYACCGHQQNTLDYAWIYLFFKYTLGKGYPRRCEVRKNFREWVDTCMKSKIEKHVCYFQF